MDISEVSIGDWVLVNKKPVCVTLAILSVWNADLIYPIPITKELLEKNGFVEIELALGGGRKKKSIVREGIDVAIDFVFQEHWIIHVGELFHEAHMMIDYLHEFQHLLTLCKIDFEFNV